MLVRNLDNYPCDKYKSNLNILAISPDVKLFRGGKELNILD
jgi:hypothetical protein